MNFTKYDLLLKRTATILAVAILTLALLAAVTGALLGYYYQPTAGGAYESLQTISDAVSSGWLVHSLHKLAGNGIIGLALVQMVVMFLGRQFRPSWLVAWVGGIALILTTIGLGWTAMILDWTQTGYWRLSVELGTIEAIPFLGQTLRNILTGGGISTDTVIHVYALHSYVLSVAAIALAVIHLGGLVVQETEFKQAFRQRLEQLVADEVEESENAERVDFAERQR
ncbi:MAG: cytochrome bc complex cytochrome b subunit [Kamptonema sp. SIO4C4]|nr:cytochrome bc complex cytochrome b subunit [Kamptonema sp. SIO4C4]